MKLRRAVDGVQREQDATRKAHMQEEEFKLQNETMKRELDEVRNFRLKPMMISIDYDNDNIAYREKRELK